MDLLPSIPNAFNSYSMLNYIAVLNTEVEDTKLAASCVEGDELVDCHEHNPSSCDMGHRDQSKETESEAPKELSQSNELAPAIEIEKGTMPDSAAGQTKTSDQSVSLLESSSVTMPDEASKEMNKKMEHSANALIVRDDGVEAAPTKKPMEAETERNRGTYSSALSGELSLYLL